VTPCKYGDPLCPCQDGDQCHYEGPHAMMPPHPKPGDRWGAYQYDQDGWWRLVAGPEVET
jgi:hypothetical protein